MLFIRVTGLLQHILCFIQIVPMSLSMRETVWSCGMRAGLSVGRLDGLVFIPCPLPPPFVQLCCLLKHEVCEITIFVWLGCYPCTQSSGRGVDCVRCSSHFHQGNRYACERYGYFISLVLTISDVIPVSVTWLPAYLMTHHYPSPEYSQYLIILMVFASLYVPTISNGNLQCITHIGAR